MASLSELIAAHKAAQAAQANQPGVSAVREPNGKSQTSANLDTTTTPITVPTTTAIKAPIVFSFQPKVPAPATVSPPPQTVVVEQAAKAVGTSAAPAVGEAAGAAVSSFDLQQDVTDILKTGITNVKQADLEGFRKTLEIIREAYKKELPGQDISLITSAMKNILGEVRQHEEFMKLLLPQDIGMLVRILRESYGVVLNVKVTREKKKNINKKDEDEFRSLMDGFGDLGDLG